MVGGVAGALLLFAYLGAWTVQRRAERMRVAEVMRLAG
jgi:cytochrome oxidase assembly protein ShyY1